MDVNLKFHIMSTLLHFNMRYVAFPPPLKQNFFATLWPRFPSTSRATNQTSVPLRHSSSRYVFFSSKWRKNWPSRHKKRVFFPCFRHCWDFQLKLSNSFVNGFLDFTYRVKVALFPIGILVPWNALWFTRLVLLNYYVPVKLGPSIWWIAALIIVCARFFFFFFCRTDVSSFLM